MNFHLSLPSVEDGDRVVEGLRLGFVRGVEETSFAGHADHKVLTLVVEAQFARAQHCLENPAHPRTPGTKLSCADVHVKSNSVYVVRFANLRD